MQKSCSQLLHDNDWDDEFPLHVVVCFFDEQIVLNRIEDSPKISCTKP